MRKKKDVLRIDDRGISTIEAVLIAAAAGTIALAFVAAFTGAFDGLLGDFNSVFGG
ncbi:hypothetical protein ACFC1B_06810 [Streptomyces xiamenensis]|uniref:hypothetical protein n=1 Tax=Streptomyces xiamenensis TaxID=408015 RepID=UPI0035D6288A